MSYEIVKDADREEREGRGDEYYWAHGKTWEENARVRAEYDAEYGPDPDGDWKDKIWTPMLGKCNYQKLLV